MSDRENVQSRNWSMLLYPDDDNFDIDAVIEYFPHYAWILHDRDDGKKPHIHFLGKLDYPVRLSAVSNNTHVDSRLIQQCHSCKAFLRYMTHQDSKSVDDGKAQYSKDDITSNFDVNISVDDNRTENARKILDYCLDNPGCRLVDLVSFAVDNNCWSELCRGQRIFCELIRESGYANKFNGGIKNG